MSDFNFMVSTEGLHEKGREIGVESRKIRDALDKINDARKSLDGWVSSNKERYDNKLAEKLPKMYDMTKIIDSYSEVAINTSDRAVEVENKIAAAIENDDDVAA